MPPVKHQLQAVVVAHCKNHQILWEVLMWGLVRPAKTLSISLRRIRKSMEFIHACLSLVKQEGFGVHIVLVDQSTWFQMRRSASGIKFWCLSQSVWMGCDVFLEERHLKWAFWGCLALAVVNTCGAKWDALQHGRKSFDTSEILLWASLLQNATMCIRACCNSQRSFW